MADGLDAVAKLSRLLIEHGPLAEPDIVARLQADGVANPEAVVHDELGNMGSAGAQLLDDRWVWLPELLAGAVFTHRVTADEVAHDLLTATLDLRPIAELCMFEQFQALADGSPVSLVDHFDFELLDERGVLDAFFDDLPALLLPVGTLAALGAAADDLIGLRLTDSGLVLERVTDLASTTDVGAMLVATLRADMPTLINPAVWTMCADEPALFAEPLRPLSDVIAECDLAFDAESLAPPGFDIGGWRTARLTELLAERCEIGLAEARAIHALTEVYDGMLEADGSTPPDHTALPSDVSSALSDPFLAEVLLSEIDYRGYHPAVLRLFAETLEPRVTRRAKPAFRWLRATALDRMGDIADAEREFSAAESMDTEFWPALFDLARYASDRGDAERGLALLDRAGANPDHPLVLLLQAQRVAPRTDLGRNDACWCGSGRKYKKCHLGKEVAPIEQRANWLYLKACQHITHTGWQDLLDAVVDIRSTYDDSNALEPGFVDPVVMDAVLCEGGAFEDFLATRGSLLPDDERSLAEQWLLVRRSVFEVEQVEPGRTVDVRDVGTGDLMTVTDRLASTELAPGQSICTRVLPAGREFQFYGGVGHVAPQQRGPLIELLDSEPNPIDLVEFLSARSAPDAAV